MSPEGAIKHEICNWLEIKQIQGKCLFWINQAGKIPGRINRSKYLRNGVPDILGSWEGRPLAIEVKTKTGKVSPEQKKFIEDALARGWIAFVARSLDDVKQVLDDYQILGEI
jgi:hypothetical protein